MLGRTVAGECNSTADGLIHDELSAGMEGFVSAFGKFAAVEGGLGFE